MDVSRERDRKRPGVSRDLAVHLKVAGDRYVARGVDGHRAARAAHDGYVTGTRERVRVRSDTRERNRVAEVMPTEIARLRDLPACAPQPHRGLGEREPDVVAGDERELDVEAAAAWPSYGH